MLIASQQWYIPTCTNGKLVQAAVGINQEPLVYSDNNESIEKAQGNQC